MLKWIGLPEAAVWWIVIASAAMLVLTLVAVPVLVIRIPPNYFADEDRPDTTYPRRYTLLRWIWLIIKNALGAGFVILGALMLVLPGQGILTILIGIMLLDFPGKFRLQRWVVSQKGVLDSSNWVREKRGKEPLVLER